MDKVIQGNTENIVFLKSTDESMIEQLVKMSGTTHESRVDQKTITRDNERILSKNEGKISYTMATKERAVIEFNDFMTIAPRNSIILKAGVSPLWNRRETVHPMSWRLFANQIKIPGKKFSLQTIPTNSSAKDFDVRKNQPDFYNMLKQRINQAKLTDRMKESYLMAYGLSETDLIRLDQNVVSDDLMHAINSLLYNVDHKRVDEAELEDVMSQPLMDEFGELITTDDMMDAAEDNVELEQQVAIRGAEAATHEEKRYAGGHISRADLVSMSGDVVGQLNTLLAIAYGDTKNYFEDHNFRVTDTGQLTDANGVLFVRTTMGDDKSDIEALQQAENDPGMRVYSEDESLPETHYEVTEAFVKYLASLESWHSIADGRFEEETSKLYQKYKM